jgi:hypothetical protein
MKLRQVSQFFKSDGNCFCCCLDYSAGVELAFKEYSHRDDPASSVVTTSGKQAYMKRVRVNISRIDGTLSSTMLFRT